MTPMQIIEFLEDFRTLVAAEQESSKYIQLEIDHSLLEAFKGKAARHEIPCDEQIKRLMKQWLENSPSTTS